MFIIIITIIFLPIVRNIIVVTQKTTQGKRARGQEGDLRRGSTPGQEVHLVLILVHMVTVCFPHWLGSCLTTFCNWLLNIKKSPQREMKKVVGHLSVNKSFMGLWGLKHFIKFCKVGEIKRFLFLVTSKRFPVFDRKDQSFMFPTPWPSSLVTGYLRSFWLGFFLSPAPWRWSGVSD